MKNDIKFRKAARFAINLVVFLSFLTIHIMLCLHHEAWRDEAQSWVIAKNLSFGEIMRLLPSEGHPFLWFAILKIATLFGLPYKYFCLFTTVIVSVAVAIMMFTVDLPVLSKVCIILSGLFFYQNPVVSRTYALIVLILVIMVALWHKRFEHPVLFGILTAIMFQSHIIMAGLSCGLLFIMLLQCFREKFKNTSLIVGTLIGFISLMSLPFQLFQVAGTSADVTISGAGILSKLNVESVKNAVISINFALFERNSGKLYTVGVVLIIFALILATILGLCGLDGGIVAFASYSAGFIIIAFLYEGTGQMRNTWFLGTSLFLIGTIRRDLKNWLAYIIVGVFSFFFLLSFSLAGKDALDDYNNPMMCDSLSFSQYVAETVPENSILLVSESFSVPAAYAYMCELRPDITVYSIDKQDEYRFHHWGLEYPELSQDEWNDILIRFDNSQNIYYWNCALKPTAPSYVMAPEKCIYNNLSSGSLDGNQLYIVK